MKDIDLVVMMFKNEPVETFEKLLMERKDLEWEQLLDMCYCEESYESVGGDFGGEDNPPINYEKLEYLGKLIGFLENNGVKVTKSF